MHARDAGPQDQEDQKDAGRATRLLRRFVAWVLHEAETPAGGAGLVALSFTGSALIPIFLEPPLILLTTGLPYLWRRFALLFAAGSILGGIATYIVGYAFVETLGSSVVRFWGAEASWNYLLSVARGGWGFAVLAAIAVGPGPYKLVTMAAGATAMPFPAFLAILVVGRLARFLAVAWLTRLFGPKMLQWLKIGHTPRLYAAVAALLLAGLVVYVLTIWLTR